MEESRNEMSGEKIELKPEEQKELSPEEKAEVDRNRSLFRQLHDSLEGDIYTVEGHLGTITGLLTQGIQTFQKKVKVSELELKFDDPQVQKCLDFMGDMDVQKAMTFSEVMHNAIQRHKYLKTKDWTVKDLEIHLL